MTFLYPSVLWLLLPITLLLIRGSHSIVIRVHLVVLMLLLLTLSRPIIKESLQEVQIHAQDIIIALDVSYSMKATDVNPTRYTFAKETIQILLQQNPTDNIMLIVFTSNPLLLSPPTTDHKLIDMALQSFNPEFILTKGTSLKKLFAKISTIHTGHKDLILITDGGEENDVETLTQLLGNSNISLITLALGSEQGTTIKSKNNHLLKNNKGHLVISRINPLLETLTHAVNGVYLTASSTPLATAKSLTYTLSKKIINQQTIQKMQYHYRELYRYPLLLALLLFLMVHTRAVKYLIIVFALLGFQAQASFLDDYHLHIAYEAYASNDFNSSKLQLEQISTHSLQSKLTLANTHYKTQAYKKAITLYKSIRSSSMATKQHLYYNIANAYTQLGSFSKAKIYYTKVLQLGTDADASYNLKRIALLKDKDDASLGIAHPKSQSDASSKSESQKKEDKTKEEDEPSSGSGASGAGEESKNDEKNKDKKSKLLNDETPQEHPLSSKVYELINKGYIRETQPW